MSWQEISEQDWERIPSEQPQEPDDVDQMLDAVAAGKIICYTPKDDQDATGKRLSLARRAKRRGFTIEIRPHGGQLAIRKAGEIVSQPAQPETGIEDDTPPAPRKRGRKATGTGSESTER